MIEQTENRKTLTELVANTDNIFIVKTLLELAEKQESETISVILIEAANRIKLHKNGA